MDTMTVSRARAGFSAILRRVIRTRRPVVVRTPNGLAQIAHFDLPEEVAEAPRGSLGKYTAGQRKLVNTLGESL
jgi:hypothetical protein